MELSELLMVKPGEYLSRGFFDEAGEEREGINGYSSLAMAFRCREEGLRPETLRNVTLKLEHLAEMNVASIDENPDLPISPGTRNEMEAVRHDAVVEGSSTLSEIFDAASPRVRTWKDYAAFTLHLERVLAQLALVSMPEPEAPKDAV